jgi:hypothetical protein
LLQCFWNKLYLLNYAFPEINLERPDLGSNHCIIDRGQFHTFPLVETANPSKSASYLLADQNLSGPILFVDFRDKFPASSNHQQQIDQDRPSPTRLGRVCDNPFYYNGYIFILFF